MAGRVLTNEELDAIIAEPWTAYLHSYEDIAKTLDVLRRSAKSWHRAYDVSQMWRRGETTERQEGKHE